MNTPKFFRDYKTEKIISNEPENTEIHQKRLGAMKIPTLSKGFLRSMAPTLGVAALKESETAKSDLSSIEEGEIRPECSHWPSKDSGGKNETTSKGQ